MRENVSLKHIKEARISLAKIWKVILYLLKFTTD